MTVTAPTTSEVTGNIVAQVEASLNQTIPLLPRAFVRVLAKALAGVVVILYKYGGFIHLQQFVRTASNQPTVVNGRTVVPLAEWATLFGIPAQTSATAAELVVTVTVENQVGSLPSGTQLVGSTNGVTYLTLSTVALDAATKDITVRAVADQAGGGGLGTIGNLTAGAVVSFANPLANVARDTIVQSQTVTGADPEPEEDFRQRVIDGVRARPQGGAYSDYRIWGAAVAGITQVYPYTGDPGQVDVYVESATEPDGIPTAGQLQAVADAIELDEDGLATRRPAGALVNTLAITRNAWTAEVSGLNVPASVSLAVAQSQITTAVQNYFLARENFIVGLDTPPRRDVISRSAVIGTVENVVTALGGTFTTVVIERVSDPGVPVTIDTLAEGEKAKATVAFV